MSNHASLIRYENEGKPVVRRGKHFIEFDLGNGVTRHVATIDPLHYGVDYANEVDTAWEADTGAWQWRIIKNSHLIHSRDIFNVGSLFEWRIGEEWVVIDPQSINWINQDNSREQIAIKQAVAGVANDDVMHFEAAYGSGRHYTFIAHPKRLIKHITIDSLASLPTPTITGEINFEAEFTITNSAGIELYLDGVKWARSNNVRVRTSNRIEFRDANGIAQWYADAPVATDANGETVTAQYEVARLGGTYFIRVRVPREWMVSAAYPVTIDPTFTDGYGGDVTTAKDDGVYSALATYNYGANVSLPGYADSKMLFEFVLASIDAGATCNSATLYLYHNVQGIDRAWDADVYSIASGNDGWIEGTKSGSVAGAGEPCWNAKEADGSGGVTTAWAGSAGLSTSGTDYEASSIGSFSGNRSDAVGAEYSTLLTAARIEGWFGDPNTNYGIICTFNNIVASLCSSDHATTGYRPKLVVDWTAAGGATVTLKTAAATATGIPLSVDAPVSRTLDTASITATGIQASISAPAPATTVVLSTATATATGIALAVDAPVTRTLSTAALTGTGIGLAVDAPISRTMGTATLTATGVPLTVSTPPPGQNISLSTATLTATGVALTLDAPISRTLSTASLTATGIALAVIEQQYVSLACAAATATGISTSIVAPVTVTFSTSSLTATGVGVTISSLYPSLSVTLACAALVGTGIGLSIDAPVLRVLDTAALTATGVPVTPYIPTGIYILLDTG